MANRIEPRDKLGLRDADQHSSAPGKAAIRTKLFGGCKPAGKARRRRPAHLQVVIMSTKKPIKHYLQFSDFTLEEYEY
ncbi:MAG: hypothetical protein RR376_09675, partial [Janthinobacterium sp.]